jgi:hypothetical protein
MPRGNGTGPLGQGPGSGRGRGLGQRSGKNQANRPAAGAAGYCLCPSCGKRLAHTQGVHCYKVRCPECGAKMIRT